jgi:hypothetical protein
MNWLQRIWEYDRWLIKLILLVSFIFITGFPQATIRFAAEEQKRHPVDERIRVHQIDRIMFERVKQVERQIAEGRVYSPDEYFEDLKQYYEKCRELKISQGIDPQINRLQWLMQKGVTEKKFTNWDIDRAAKAYRYYLDSGKVHRDELSKSAQDFGLKNILLWLLWLYLKTLPLVFVLYLVWAKDEAGYRKFLMPKPRRFFVLLILYPFVIGYNIYRAIREDERRMAAEAELRRTRKLFDYVSEEEQEKIRQFAKSNLSLAEWRSQLAEMGLRPRHSFAAAMIVTLLFVIVVRPAEASAKQAKDFTGNATLEQIANSQNLARMSIDHAKKIRPEKSSWPWEGAGADLALESISSAVCPRCVRLAQQNIIALLTEFFRDIFHIPLQAAGFEANIEVQPQF